MCQKIIINRGEKEIETPRQVIDHFNLNEEQIAKHLDDYTPNEFDSCLCQVDFDILLTDLNIEYKERDGDYYVGLLDELSEVNEEAYGSGCEKRKKEILQYITNKYGEVGTPERDEYEKSLRKFFED